jgi:hypothetical protein
MSDAANKLAVFSSLTLPQACYLRDRSRGWLQALRVGAGERLVSG